MADPQQYLAAVRQEIAAHVAGYFASGQPGNGLPLSSHGQEALQLLRQFAERPGKLLRGTLAAVSYEMFNAAHEVRVHGETRGTARQTALDVALALELNQVYLLIVDDVMDRSDTRRGGPTMHRLFQQASAGSTGQTGTLAVAADEHFANMLAVNTGLIAGHLAAGLLASAAAPASSVVRASQLFHANITATALGQIDDLYNVTLGAASAAGPAGVAGGQAVAEEDIVRTYLLKSSYYTCINPLQVGAALAGAGDDVLQACYDIGQHAGLAFQLQDDNIGMFGSAEDSGKSAMDDLREGKQTLLMAYGLAQASASDAATLRRALGNASVTAADHAQVQAILTNCGARRATTERAVTEMNQALQLLQAQTQWEASGVAGLTELFRQLMERKS